MSRNTCFADAGKTLSVWRVAVLLAVIGVAGSMKGSTEVASAASLSIASQGNTQYSIVVPQIAAHSVNAAAAEMQRSVKEATGATLPIRKDSEAESTPFISLGSTQQAKIAGISAEKIPDEGFRIVTRGENLFIIGLDTTTVVDNSRWQDDMKFATTLHPEIPGPAFTKHGGFSSGTANGVYTFLEDHVGVRWLFPGELGRDVPPRSTLAINATDRTEAPRFNFRVMGIIRGGGEWKDKQKLGLSHRIRFSHNFKETVPAALYEKHPDWFPMINGVRPKPPASNYKLETTNPELVRFFADRAIAALKADPQMTTYPISPSDGRGWSESPESKALYDPPSASGGVPSVTPLVLKFYRDVAAIVAKEYPQGKLGGYLYQDFSHPPANGDMKLPENLIPVIVGKSMGFTFYRAETRELEAKLLQEWSKVAPENWYYYGMPTWLRETSAMVTPAAPDELNFLYSNMVKAGIKGAYIYGSYIESQAALVNYLNAKMLWNPSGDAREVQRDFLTRAYGPKAGAVMERLYNKLDESWWSDYFRSPQSTHYNVSDLMFRSTFGKHYPAMEKLFLEALAQPMTEKQKQRLDLIKYNMIALQFRLRNAGFLPAEYSSPLTRTPEEVFELFTAEETRNHFSYAIVNNPVIAPLKVQLSQAEAAPVAATKAAPAPNSSSVLLYPTRDGEVRITPSEVSPGASFLSYYVQDAAGKIITRGFMTNNRDITFQAQANQPYYFKTGIGGVTHRPQVKWKIAFPDAAPATARFENGVLSLASTPAADTAPLLVYAPQETRLEISGDTAGVLVQTESDAQANNKAAGIARKDATLALQKAQDRYQANVVQNLNRGWKFSPDAQNSGEQNGFFKPDFDDSSWKTIEVIGPWQINGFPDYYGTTWYRRTITLTAEETDPLAVGNKGLLLFFGAVDGDAEFYLNGQKIGQHIMANYSDGWERPIALNATASLNIGKNVLAVKVTKNSHVGGIYRGASLLSGVLPKE